MRIGFKLPGGLLAGLSCALCAAQPATEYRIDPDESSVSIYVYSDGPLARLGHNHVMTSNSLEGSVSVQDQAQQVVFELSFPVAKLVVDDPEQRRRAGPDFPPDLTAADRDVAARNMLGRKVLDARDYPTISLQSVQSSGPLQSPLITVRITIRGVRQDTPVPASLQFEEDSLTARGEFDVRQSDFGITPFSIAFGALHIDDRLHVKFEIRARAASRS